MPEVLGADDTADVIIKHRLEDGTLEDFPPEQTFELGVLDGCVNGNFMVGDSINVYFADALQPIKFVTADELDPEFDKVLIRVGTDLGGGGGSSRPIGKVKGEEIKEKRKSLVGDTDLRLDTLRAGFEKMIAEKKAEAEAKKNKVGKEPPIEAPIVEACYPYGPNKEYNLQGFIITGDESIEIMLGETKYFQAKFNETEQKLEIVEVEDQLTGVSQNEGSVDGEEGWVWVTEDIWGTEPVTPVIEDGLSAVYWEKRYPVYDDIRDYLRSDELDDGLIRVMGRFWQEKEAGENESEYKNKHSVELTAMISNDVTKTIVLTVIKPNKLGTKHNQEKDVFGNFYNLDEEIFYYAGKYGIPPQFIKADIEAEGNFNPAYRYEPFYTIKRLYNVDENGKFGLVHDLLISSPYRITVDGKIYLDASNINGTANIGPIDGLEDHVYITNGVVTGGLPVTIDGYPGYTGSIWDDFYANCKTVNPDALYDIYPKKYPQWSQDAIDGWQEKYDEFYSNWEKKIGTTITLGGVIIEITEELVKLAARLYANEWLKTEYRGGIFQKGIAQTRLAASYGLMQPIFPTANAYWQYNDKPEFLNENDINFSNAIQYLKLNVSKNQGTTLDEIDKKNNFSLGLEESYIFIFNNYHGSHEEKYGPNKNIYYGHNVINKNKKYDPIK